MSTPKKRRGPSYPSFGLPKAIEHIQRIERDHRRSEILREDAFHSMGFSSRSGSSLQAMATLSTYGLLERRGKGLVAVSERAQAIMFAASAAERLEKMRAAAFAPPLFADLQERFPGFSPPEQGVIAALRRMGLAEGIARKVTIAYRDTIACVSNDGESDRTAQPLPTGPGLPDDSGLVAEELPHAAHGSSPAGDTGMQLHPVEFTEWMRIPVGGATAIRVMVNGPIGAPEFGVMMRTLEIQGAVIAKADAPTAEAEDSEVEQDSATS